ncbi:MAG: flavin reductase family protein, partial [Candidatus Omnitrophota bacterium]
MAMSWHTMIDFDPPIVGCVISDCSHTFNVLKKTGQCVLNIPTVELASKVLRCGGVSGLKTDKFKQAGLTPVAASYVKAPLVGECYANLECKVIDSSLKTRYNLFILQVLKAWVDPSKKNPRTIHHLGGGRFSVDGRTIHPSCGPR